MPAAGILAVNAHGRVLLQRRRDTGQWAIPMGKQELGETVTASAVRETEEETGVKVRITGLLGIFSDPRHIVLYHSNGETRQEYEVIFSASPYPGCQARTTKHPTPAGTPAATCPASTFTCHSGGSSATG